MAQMNICVSDELEEKIKSAAQQEGKWEGDTPDFERHISQKRND